MVAYSLLFALSFEVSQSRLYSWATRPCRCEESFQQEPPLSSVSAWHRAATDAPLDRTLPEAHD